VALIGDAGAKAMTALGAIVAAIVVAVIMLWTDLGARMIAAGRCTPSWLTADRAAYLACYDVEREQIIENRAKRRTRFDE
jgi:hypothetical protein